MDGHGGNGLQGKTDKGNYSELCWHKLISVIIYFSNFNLLFGFVFLVFFSKVA